MKIRPLNNWVVLRRDHSGEEKKGRIHIPEASQEVPTIGTVVAVGRGKPIPAMITEELEIAIEIACDETFDATKHQENLQSLWDHYRNATAGSGTIAPQVAVGDKVVTRIHAGAPLDWGGYSEFADLVTVREDEILAVIED